MTSETASRIAGLLYGNILHRNGDPEGYKHYYNIITNNEQTLTELIYDFYVCDEFINSFVVNETPNELVRNLLSTFFNVELADVGWVAGPLNVLVKQGLPATIKYFLDDNRYQDRHGPQSVPRYVVKHSLPF